MQLSQLLPLLLLLTGVDANHVPKFNLRSRELVTSNEETLGCPNREDMVNLSLNQPVSMSSVYSNAFVETMANDGDISTTAITKRQDSNWLRVDLQAGSTVDQVRIFRRQNCSACNDRTKEFTVRLLKDGETVGEYYQGPVMNNELIVSFCGQEADQVEIAKDWNMYLEVGEVIVEGKSSTLFCPNRENMMNLSLNQPVSMSSVYNNNAKYDESKATDGDINTVSITKRQNTNWLRVDLPADSTVDQVRIIRRQNCSACNGRTKEFTVRLLQDGETVAEYYQGPAMDNELVVSFCGQEADQVEIAKDWNMYLEVGEVYVEGKIELDDLLCVESF